MKTLRIINNLLLILIIMMVIVLLAAPARADRLVSDPYPTGQPATPDNCQISRNGGAYTTCSPMEAVTGGVRCTCTTTGDNYATITYSVKACQGLLCSAATPFVPADHTPAAPGLHLIGG